MPTPLTRQTLGTRAGAVSLALGLLALGAVLCFHFPERLTTPELRALYPVPFLRDVLSGGLLAAFGLGLISLALGGRRRHATAGLVLASLAMALGGAGVAVEAPVEPARFIGLDWLVLDFFVVALIFVPLERVFVRVRSQKVLRAGWKTDLLHYATSHLLIGVTVVAITAPSIWIAKWLAVDGVAAHVAVQPLWLQFVEVVVIADLTQYAVHRLFHSIPWLWRFHAVHHSSREMDWLAGSRLHLVDIVVTRGLTLVPLALLGFADPALHAYLVFVAALAVFIHSNTRFEFRGLRWLLATPAYHHWHHSVDEPNCNFAVSLPIIDRVFGTHVAGRTTWPDRFGIEGDPVRDGWLAQLLDPFTGRTR